MSSYHGWTHAPKAQGGTDPIPGVFGPQFCVLQGWAFTSDASIPSEAWTEIVGAGPPDGYYQDAYRTPGFPGNFDFDTGAITIQGDYLAWAVGWVQLAEVLDPGESLGVGLYFGASYRIVNSVVTGPSNSISDQRVMVAGPVGETEVIGGTATRLIVYHDHPSAVELSEAHLQVVTFGPLIDSLWQQHP